MEFKKGQIIGHGATATVSMATVSGEILAVKSAEKKISSSLESEKEILSKLKSPYIVQYKGEQITYENNKEMYNILMEYVPCGSISDLGGNIDESTIKVFTNQILLGLSYLHDMGIVHCDIKGQNVLIGKEGVKIADFGSAKRVGTKVFSGTPAFMAPEVARGEEQSFPADIWAVGCTVIEMITGSHPFPNEENPVSVLYRVGFSGCQPEIPKNVSFQAKDFLSKCFERDSKKRATVKELLKHSLFNGLKLDVLEFDEFTRVSPTSVLEQGFWDSVEGPTSSQNSVHVSDGDNSLLERITGLVGVSDSDTWDCDEDWISVRRIESEDSIVGEQIEPIEVQEFGSLIFENLDTLVDFSDELAVFYEIGTSVQDCFDEMAIYDEVNRMPEFYDGLAIFLDCFDALRDREMLCNVLECTVSVRVDSDRNLMKFYYCSIRCFGSNSIVYVFQFSLLFLRCYNSLIYREFGMKTLKGSSIED